MDFKSIRKVSIFQKMNFYFVVVVFVVFSFGEITLGQTPSPTAIVNQTITATQTPLKKKKDGPNPYIYGNKTPLSMQGAHKLEEEKQAELKKEGKIKEFGIPGTVRKIPKPLPPANLEIKPGDGLVYLSWNEVPSNWDKGSDGKALGDMSYIVYISEDGVNFQQRSSSSIKKTQIAIGNLINGKTYYFGITSLGEGGRESEKTVGTAIPGVINPSAK